MSFAATYTAIVKQESRRLGFEYCGISRAEVLDEDARRLEAWLRQGMQGKMQYMENHFDKRINPTLLVPGARSVITLLLNYYPSQQQSSDKPQISKYAYGNDYHEIIRDKLNNLLDELRTKIGAINGRGFVDSAPVLERAWARKSGLGWIGKNGNMITKSAGSFFFIATLITDLELVADDPYAKDYCGSCSRCITACPTQAILPDRVVDGSKCISYFTIELKDELLPSEYQGQFGDWIFGCDVCQDVCPWNRFSRPGKEPALQPIPEVLDLSNSEWAALSEEAFRKIFRHSPLKRTKWKGIQRNLSFREIKHDDK
ncbi:tRNA epoxyqueuosine(34) reductase QueG [Niabella terrae]